MSGKKLNKYKVTGISLKKLIIFCLITGIGFLLNITSIPLFFGVDLIFGGTAVVLIILLYGRALGTLAAFLIAGYTFVLWGHPYAIVIFTAEAFFIATGIKRFPKISPVIIDIVYWLFIGMPLVVVFYKFVLGLGFVSVLLIMFKQMMNGVAYTILGLLIFYFVFAKVKLFKNIQFKITLPTVIFEFAAIPILLIGLLSLVEHNNDNFELSLENANKRNAELSGRIQQELDSFLSILVHDFNYFNNDQSNNNYMNALDHFSESYPEVIGGWYDTDKNEKVFNSQIPQKLRYYINRLDVAENHSNSGIRLFPEIHTEWNEPFLVAMIKSDDHSDKSINLILKKDWATAHLNTIIGEDDIVFISGSEDFPFTWTNKKNTIIQNIYSDLTEKSGIWVPEEKNISVMAKWNQSLSYLRLDKDERIPWSIISATMMKPFIDTLHRENLNNLIFMEIVMILVLIGAFLLSGLIAKDIGNISQLAFRFSQNPLGTNNISWPDSKILEVKRLAEQFQNLVSSNRKNLLRAKQQEEEQTNLIQNANAPIIALDVNGNVTNLNMETESIIGYNLKEIIGKEFIPLIIEPENIDRANQILKKIVAGESATNLEFPIRTRSGQSKMMLFNLNPRTDINGDITGCLVVGQEISKLSSYRVELEETLAIRTKETKQHLKLSEDSLAKLNGVMQSIGSGILVLNSKREIILTNQVAAELLHKRSDELVNQNIINTGIDESFINLIQNTIAQNKYGKQLIVQLHNDKGPKTIVSARIFEIKNGKKLNKEHVVAFRNYTEDFKLEQSKTEFLTMASHELKTPLTNILGYSELLVEKPDLSNDKRQKYLAYVYGRAKNMDIILNNMLDADAEDNDGFLEFAPVDLSSALNETIALLKPLYNRHEFTIELPTGSTIIEGNSKKITNTFYNVLKNSLEYSPNGGNINIAFDVDEKNINISIKDEGIGMSSKEMEKIYEKYYRGHASGDGISGAGIGMYLVKKNMLNHKGDVSVNSKKGEGTTVNLIFPKH